VDTVVVDAKLRNWVFVKVTTDEGIVGWGEASLTTPAAAIQVGRVLAPFRPWFLDEPVQPGNVDALVEVARALPIPIATGERLTTRWEFVEVLAKRAVVEAAAAEHPYRQEPEARVFHEDGAVGDW
jgi:L-alanine-DL-glutamate epimerase-like enolase superfamily enzyme